MKKLSLYIFLVLMFCNVSFAETWSRVYFKGSEKISSLKKVCNMFTDAKKLVMSFKKHNEIISKESGVKKHLLYYGNTIGIKSSKVYETKLKGFYPERLIREYMKDSWILTDKLGLLPKIQYKMK